MNFVGLQTWAAIKRVVRDKGRHWVAVPYVSPGAAKRLPLKPGDVLITRFDDATIMAGQTDPKAIARYIRKGVEVHSEPWLHAKVYVSSTRAVISSANVSANSEHDLLEAGMEIVHRGVISDARRFVQELRGAIIGLEFANKKIGLFKTGERGRKRRKVGLLKERTNHSLWIVGLVVKPTTEEEENAARRAKKKAITRMKDQKAFRLEEFTFFGKFPAQEGDYVVQSVKEGRNIFVEPTAQVLVIEPFSKRGGQSISVVVEIRKRVRARSLRQMDAAVKPMTSKQFPRVRTWRHVRNDALRKAIHSLWPTVAGTNVAR
jgi:hypothetical protein